MKTLICYNAQLTQKVIALHDQGFDQDFILQDGILICTQDNQSYRLSEAMITKEIAPNLDLKNRRIIHKVETLCGIKGLMLLEN